MMHYWYYNNGYNFNPGFGILGFIFQVAWWLLILWLVLSLIRHFSHHDHFYRDGYHDRALQILRERYAKGEITKKEFDEMKQDLS